MVNLIVGDDGSNSLSGTAGQDLIYGFNPNGPQSQVSSITATRVASGLDQPLYAVAPPGDLDRLFLVEKTGQIKILDLKTGAVLATPFLDVSGQISSAGEGGLLGLAFHPDFAQNGFFYVNVINSSGDTEIRRYHVSANPNQADAASSTLVITIDQPDGLTNHKAGWLDFGPDGYLYAALGDGGGGGDPFGNGQNINTLLGKILRLDVNSDAFPADATRNYAIPADNPFVGTAGADEIFAFGLRNPWRPSFDRALGDLYIADVGQGSWEEIDLGQKGANYGWNVFEGPAVFAGGTPTGGSAVAPIYSYDHSVGQSITGGYVYRGESEGLQGQYFFADFVQGKVFTLHFDGSAWTAVEHTSQITTDFGAINNPSSFGQDGRGNLYLVDFDGEVFKLTPRVTSFDQGDNLQGLGGDDMIYGGSGNDSLNGGAGNDMLLGGAGADRFMFDNATSGADVVGDFVPAQDLMVLSRTGFGLATGGSLAAAGVSFVTGTSATTAGPTILYDPGTGNISWDGDGTGAGAAMLLARVALASIVTPNADISYSSTAGWNALATGDFNNDGADDVLWQSTAGQTGAWLMSNGQIASTTNYGSTAGWSVLAAGDLNHDGTDDLLWRSTGGQTGAWLMSNGQIASTTNYGSTAGWSVIGTGDFNNDGTDDLLWQSTGGQTGAWMMSSGQIASTTNYGSTAGWSVIGTGDINSDGTDDILWRSSTGQTTAWFMSNGGVAGVTNFGSTAGWTVLDTGDFNHDGTMDVLWRDAQGQTATWLVGIDILRASDFLVA